MIDPALLDLSTRLGAALSGAGTSLALAESCTGGLAAAAVTAVAGSSAWFDRGFVTYSNDAKRELLGVAAATLEAHGAVSEETAREMAAGALAASGAGLAAAITGIAGPGGAVAGKPVGTVCFAWARRGEPPRALTRHFSGDRAEVRRQAVVAALEGCIGALSGTGGGA